LKRRESKPLSPLPPFTEAGDLPVGVHRATLRNVIERFGRGSRQRVAVASRLARIHELAANTRQVRTFVVFGSFVTAKSEPEDVDVFLVMEDGFDVAHLQGEERLLFDHPAAQAYFGASVFWLRRLAALGGEEEAVAHWQLKRNGERRGIIQIVEEKP
jgi:predicted nucleotidyltransferase